MKIKNIIIGYHCLIIIVFVYIFIQFLTMKRSNPIYKIYTDYIMNKYCIILYLLLVILITKYDKFTAILLIILIIAPFKCAIKEFFENSNITNTTNTTNTSNTNNTTTTATTTTTTTTTIPYGTDDRFKMDDIAKERILKQIKSQVDFDPYKTNMGKDVIYEIYNKYFDNDIFVKLKNINDDSKQYIAEGNFEYVPQNNKVDYDLINYQNLSQNIQLGINPIVDGISNKTKINRG
jgi:hypothetical protein